MKHFCFLVIALLSTFTLWSQADEIEEIKQALAEAETKNEKMILRYELAEAYLRVDAEEAEDYGKQAYSNAKFQYCGHRVGAQKP
ncbi:MAG: hypothetical protein AAFO02_16555 [Bacteroidota bacterium]